MAGLTPRSQAVYDITKRKPMDVLPTEPLSSLWACDVLTLAKIKESLPKEVFKSGRYLSGGCGGASHEGLGAVKRRAVLRPRVLAAD